MSCTGFKPTAQYQLQSKWGGLYGSVNCTPCSAGMAGHAHTCGAMLFTGAQIRAASDEPVPDPRSPGLNLAQVDAALFRLSKGAIDLDTHYRYSFASTRTRLQRGEQAVLQIQRSVLVQSGYAFGSTFAGGHAIEIGADYTGPWFIDPLTGFHRCTWAVLEEAAGALVLNTSGEVCGRGLAYVSFTRDIVPDYRVSVGNGKPNYPFFVYQVANGVITGRTLAHTGGFSASCTAPRMTRWPAQDRSIRLVRLTSSARKGQYVSAQYAKEV